MFPSLAMASFIINWWWGGDPDIPDPTSGMSLRDIYTIQRTWAPIYSNAGSNGLLIFTRLFEADPVTKSFFKMIANVPDDEMVNNVQFRSHIINIMAALNTSIMNLKEPEIVIIWMNKLGEAHERKGIKRKHFWVLKDVLVNILKNDLKHNDDTIASWGRFVAFIYQHIFVKLSG